MYKLEHFSLGELFSVSTAIRNMGEQAHSMEEVANRIVRYIYDNFTSEQTGERAFALVRFYKTLLYPDLPPELQSFAEGMLYSFSETTRTETQCLTLLATAGDKPEWNDRKQSVRHQTIPLPTEQIVLQFPMIARLISQLGIEVSAITHPIENFILQVDKAGQSIFYEPEALGSPFVPAQQEFVIPHGIKSVIGFGRVLPSGSFFAVICFSKIPIPQTVADTFRLMSLNVFVPIVPFDRGIIFENQ